MSDTSVDNPNEYVAVYVHTDGTVSTYRNPVRFREFDSGCHDDFAWAYALSKQGALQLARESIIGSDCYSDDDADRMVNAINRELETLWSKRWESTGQPATLGERVASAVMTALGYLFTYCGWFVVVGIASSVFVNQCERAQRARDDAAQIAPILEPEPTKGESSDDHTVDGSDEEIEPQTRAWLPIPQRTCRRVAEIKGDDLARGWLPVCLAIASRSPAYGVRPSLSVAVAWHESRFRYNAIGALGEVGPLQVRPEMHCGGSDCADRIGAGLTVLARYVGEYGEARGMCRYRGAALDCDSPRVALANEIEGR